jgi:hypothetical protein
MKRPLSSVERRRYRKAGQKGLGMRGLAIPAAVHPRNPFARMTFVDKDGLPEDPVHEVEDDDSAARAQRKRDKRQLNDLDMRVQTLESAKTARRRDAAGGDSA